MTEPFVLIGTCNCNGTHNKKYKYQDWIVYITRTKYKVKKNGLTVKNYSPLATLEAFIKETIQIVPTGEQIQS